MIGWREYVGLPDWGIERVKAKADTGARTSALDVADIQELPGGRVRFRVITNRRKSDAGEVIEATIKRRARIKSSLGHSHERLIVETTLRLGEVEIVTEIGLVSRKDMRCRMLLGRRTLHGIFVVDPGRLYVLGRRKRNGQSARK